MDKRRCHHRTRRLDFSLATGVRYWHIHRATLMGHALAALALRCSHFGVRYEAGHHWTAAQDRYQQNACELAESSHSFLSLRLICD